MKRAFFPAKKTPTVTRASIGSGSANHQKQVVKVATNPCHTNVINECTVGRKGFRIDHPGVYKMTQDVHFGAKGTLIGAIEVSADNVTIDLCGHTLTGAGQIDGELNNVHGILIQSLPDCTCEARANRNTVFNVTIKNGTIENFSGAGVAAWTVDGLTVENVQLLENGNDNVAPFTQPDPIALNQNAFRFPSAGIWAHNCSNVLVSNVTALRNFAAGVLYACDKQAQNLRFVDSVFKETRAGHINASAVGDDRCAPLPVDDSSFAAHGVYSTLTALGDESEETLSLQSLCFDNCKAGSISFTRDTQEKSVSATGFSVLARPSDRIDSVSFENCTASNFEGDGLFSGFRIFSCDSVSFENCSASNISTSENGSSTNVFWALDTPSLTLTRCVVSDIQTESFSFAIGFLCQSNFPRDHVVVSNCTVENIITSTSGVFGYVFQTSEVVCNGSIAQNIIAPQLANGFVVDRETSFCVESCVAQNCTAVGFQSIDVGEVATTCGVFRDNKAMKCSIGFQITSGQVAEPESILYRNEAFCCATGYDISPVVAPIREWTLGAMPADEVAGAQLDNINIIGCQLEQVAQQTQKSVQQTIESEQPDLLALLSQIRQASADLRREKL